MEFVLFMTLTLMILMDQQVRKTKAERVLQLQSHLDAASQTEKEKTEFLRLHYKHLHTTVL